MRLLTTAIAVAAGQGCVRAADLLEPPSDVLGVATVVVAGRSDVVVLLSRPHSMSDAPTDVEPRLIGPDWDVLFSEVLDLEDDCGIEDPEVWPGSVVCLRARLPEPIRERTRYTITAAGPAGPIHGTVVVPEAPEIVEPTNGTRIAPESRGRDQPIWVRFEAVPEVGLLQAEVIEGTEITSSGAEIPIEGGLSLQPFLLDLEAGVDEILIRRAHAPSVYLGKPVKISLQFLGFENNYASFVRLAGKYPAREPYPSFGIEGAFGYFGAAAPSNPVQVIVKPPE